VLGPVGLDDVEVVKVLHGRERAVTRGEDVVVALKRRLKDVRGIAASLVSVRFQDFCADRDRGTPKPPRCAAV